MHTASDFIDCYVESMNMSKRKILGAKDKEKDIVNAIVGLWIQHRTTQETLSDERAVTVRKKRLKKDILQYICQFSAGIRTASNKSRACLAISHGYSKKTWNSATDPRVKTALKKYLIWLVKENQLMYQRSEISHGR